MGRTPAAAGLFSSTGIGRAVVVLTSSWLGLAAASLLLVYVIPGPTIIGWSVLALGSLYLLSLTYQLFVAKSAALQDGEATIWNGLARIITWNPTEGVLFLRNKQIDFIDDDPMDGGGIRVLYPLLGEELVIRVPLEIQTLTFRDTEVLTKEYMPLTIQGTIYWRISDLRRLYLQVSKEMHFASDLGEHAVDRPRRLPQIEVAEQWLRNMAEEKTRTIVSRVGTGLLIFDQLKADLPAEIPESLGLLGAPQASSTYRSATDGLAAEIKAECDVTVDQYGLEVHRVALQEVKLPAEIYAAAVDACKSSYLPLKAQAEALEIKLKLGAEAEVIGKDAAGLKGIAGNIPALAFQEFLAPLFLDFNRRRGIGVTGLPSQQQRGAAQIPPTSQ